MTKTIIPNTKPFYTGVEQAYIAKAIAKGHISGDGFYTKQVAELMCASFHANRILMTTSATHALEMVALLIGLGPGDEVIMPSYTFSSTACAVMLRGAKPVFAEIKHDTLCIDPQAIEEKITSKTKAIICVHYAGVSCDMDEILDLARKHLLYVIEDAAQGVNAKYKGKYLGTLGDLGCYSFHSTKNYTCGEGGALLINKQDKAMLERAEIIRNKGTNRSQFLRGDVAKYTWTDIGSSYTPSEILMATLLAQLEAREEIQAKREVIYRYYRNHLPEHQAKGLFRTQYIPQACESNYHLFAVIFIEEEVRDKVMKILRSKGIEASIHFLPLHSSPMGQKLGYRPEDLPITEKVSSCLLRLPMYAALTEVELEYIVAHFKEALFDAAY